MYSNHLPEAGSNFTAFSGRKIMHRPENAQQMNAPLSESMELTFPGNVNLPNWPNTHSPCSVLPSHISPSNYVNKVTALSHDCCISSGLSRGVPAPDSKYYLTLMFTVE